MAAAAASAAAALSLKSTIKLANGAAIPILGLGTWRSDPGLVEVAVKKALEAGYRLIDCAHIYGNQREVGNGIKSFLQENKSVKREDIFVVTKLWKTAHAPHLVEPQLRECLHDLQLDFVDLYLIHFPAVVGIPLVDTWKAMEGIARKGLAKGIGISNFTIEQTKQILAAATIKPLVNQIEVHPFLPNVELQQFCESQGIAIMAYSPLGNRMPGTPDNVTPLDDPIVQDVARQVGRSPAQVLIRWSLQTNHVCIPKSVTPQRIVENANVFDFELSPAQLAAIAGIKTRKRYTNPPHGENGRPIFGDG